MSYHISNQYIQQLNAAFFDYVKQKLLAFKAEENTEIGFILYFMRKIRADKGIRYIALGNNIVLFTYDKSHSKYDRTDAVTQFCRHLMIDMDCFRIIQIGITKSLDINNVYSNDVTQCLVQDFIDGTMVIYNPSLKDENRFTIHSRQQNEEASEENAQLSDNKEVSTRTKVGTGTFNCGKTFKKQFEENLIQQGTLLQNIPEDMKLNTCYIFNTTTNEEHIANFNGNVLVTVIRVKDEESCKTSWNGIIEEYDSKTSEELMSWLDQAFSNHSENMVTSLNMYDIISSFKANGVGNIVIPAEYKFDTWGKLNDYVSNCPYYTFQGLNIWTSDGRRYKIRNPRYTFVRNMMGNYPITPDRANIKNLFYLYWRLVKEHNLNYFIQIFDTINDGFYSNLFNEFRNKTHHMTRDLFDWYQNVNVNHTKTVVQLHAQRKYLVPFSIELHKKYKETRRPTTMRDVIAYINSQSAGRIFGRLYTPLAAEEQTAVEEQQPTTVVPETNGVVEQSVVV